jgi:SAM-dependent methyltransferase
MTARNARLLAFYLPQFHPIPENDEWWGPGFTEWTNVVQATPTFPGHYQPHLPADLGFYDLRLPEARNAQATLAREHGIEGFCYWHYWFNGRRLLERPFDEVLSSAEPDFPLCLAWANESWSRRWLGDGKDLLLAQEYSLADDVEHARWLTRAFADPRYVRVDGRPLFLVYRPRDLPSPRRTTDIIRREVTRAGLAEPLLLGITSFDNEDFRAVGFDGTVAFEPAFSALPGASAEGGTRCDYTAARRAMRARAADFPTYPCIVVGWDNTPRRGADAIILTDSTPERFEAGLRELVDSVADRAFEDRLVFVNAWNEWAEGNHLEPDARHGSGYLEAVDRVSRGRPSPPRPVTAAPAAPAPVSAAPPSMRREPAPLIVFGAPRSGTTYLQRVLDLHPAIFLTHETRVFAWLHAAVSVLPASDQFVVTERERFVTHLRSTLPDVVRDFYAQLNPSTRYWGDKNPHYADPNNRGCLALTAALFPGTRFVNVVRDGRDVVASLLRRNHDNGDPWVDFEAAHRTWITHLEIGRSFGARQPPGSYLEIRYEDFVRDDVVGAKELCAFLDLELPAAVEEFCTAQRCERTPLSSPTRAAIGDLSSSDWSSVLSSEEQVRSLELLGPHLVQLGYETEDSLRQLAATAAGAPPRTLAAPRRLNWGCGDCGEPGWINSDIKEGPGVDISCDIRDGLPIESDSLDYIVSVHALPMITYGDLVPVLKELRRMLKPGGVLRLCLPDADKGIHAYLSGDRSYFAVSDEDAATLGGKFILHMLWYGYSVSMFTSEFAHELLRRAGFGDIRNCRHRETASEHEGITELDNREPESFFVEATKTVESR